MIGWLVGVLPVHTVLKVFGHVGSRRLGRRWRHDAPRLLGEHQDMAAGFEQRLYGRWSEALDGLELLWLHAYEEGERHNEHRRPDAANEQDFEFDALARLHARACRVGSEVRALLRTGHPEGAHARWRTLHEIAATMFFLSGRGDDAAERYLLHHQARSYAAAEQYQRNSAALGYDRFSEAEMDQMRQTRDALKARFGKDYARPYGWAVNELGIRDPSFRDIEEAANQEHWRPWFRMASEGTHAGSRALAFTLGASYPSEMVLAGASNAGLADPGASAAISLAQATVAFLTRRPALRDIQASLMILQLSSHVEDAFMRASAQLDEEEAREREEGRGGGVSAWSASV